MNIPDRFTCEQVFRRLDDYLDRRLSADEMRMVEAHLRDCVVCAAEHKFESTVIAQVRDKLQHLDVPPDFVTRLKARLSQLADELNLE